jgi:hypothetical protein
MLLLKARPHPRSLSARLARRLPAPVKKPDKNRGNKSA